MKHYLDPTSTSDSELLVNYKYTKNKHLSLYVGAKNARKYAGGRHKRKGNWRNDHFEKKSLKQSQRKYTEVRNRLQRKGSKHKDLLSYRIQYDFDYMINRNFEFKHNLQYLLSLKQDEFLGKELRIKYWLEGEAFKGVLSCMSNSGQFELSKTIFCGDERSEPDWDEINDNVWFHMNCVQSIYIKEDNKFKNIKDAMLDFMRYKIVKYFLFLCDFKCREMEEDAPGTSPIKYLAPKYIHALDERILHIGDQEIIHCELVQEMTNKFAYGAKQTDFPCVRKESWTKENQTYFHPKQLWWIVCSYKDLVQRYIKQQRKKNVERKCGSNEEEETSSKPKTFLHWDKREVFTEIESIKKEDRTV